MTTIHKTYSFHCDESGTFRTVDTHVICPLIIENDAIDYDVMSGIWNQSLPEGAWEKFHATDMDRSIVQRVLNRMISVLFNRETVSAGYIFHKSSRDYGYDFYYGLLFSFFLWFSGIVINSENKSRRLEDNLIVKFNIFLAERGPINPLSFQKSLQSSFNKVVTEYNRQHHLPQGTFCFSTAVYLLPASKSPFIQVSDLLSNVIRAYLKGVTLSEEASAFLKGLKCTETFEHEVNTDEFKNLSGKTQSDKVIILIQKKQEVKKASTQPSPVVRVEKSFSQTLLTNLPNLIRESEQRHHERMDSLIKKLIAEDRTKQMLETDQIRVAAEIMIKNTREFTEGELLISLLQHYIETARMDDNPLTHYLDKLEVQTAVQYLAVKNHQGHFPLNDACVKQAELVAERLRQDLACWPMICDFYNNMSVSLHNIFDFSQATQRLHSLVVHLESGLKNPFQGAGIKCYEIGALFGSYSQTLAFDAHCSFFRTKDTKSLQQALDESEYYSELSREHFTDAADHERQITYQTHFKLQAYILTGDKTYLDAAGTLLLSDGKTEQAITDFITACPERRMLNPAYRVSVALKHAFLEGKNHPQTQALIDVILKNRDILPAYHPMEQIMAYLTMAAENVNQRKQLHELLSLFKAPPNIVKTILLIMQMQVAYYLQQPIQPAAIQEIADSLTPDIEPQWRGYGLIQVLREYTGTPDRWHVGPMEVLPFNYC